MQQAGYLAFYLGDFTASRAFREQQLAAARDSNDPRFLASALNDLAHMLHLEGNANGARELYKEALAIRLQLDGPDAAAGTHMNIGNLALDEGDLVEAKRMTEQALSLFRELGNWYAIGNASQTLAEVNGEMNDFPSALPLYREAVGIMADLGEKDGLGEALQGLAHAICRLGDPHRAALIWGAAEQIHLDASVAMRHSRRPRYERQVAAGRGAMGDDDTFDRTWAKGRSLTLAQALRLALGEGEPSLPSG